MNATNLKIIAVICMTLDHLSTYLGAPLPLRYIGRIAAVIFFFCAAESAVHTHDRKKYLLRLYAMSLLMTAHDCSVRCCAVYSERLVHKKNIFPSVQ